MPFWDRLYGVATLTVNRPASGDSGTAPNRVFFLQWGKSWYPYSYPGSGTPGCFQVRLYETSNIIEFCYDTSGSHTRFSGTTATIGIANSTTDWQTLNNSGASPTPSATFFTDSLSVGPEANQVYRWDPNPCSGTPYPGVVSASAITGCSPYGAMLSDSGGLGAGYGISYQWQSSPDSLTWSNIPGATTSLDSVNISTTTYYRYKVTCAVSGLSGVTPGIRLALYPPPAAITGTTTVCVGSTTTLSDVSTGGVWGSSNAAIASVGSTGVVTGVTAGSATISYFMPSGCLATIPVSVNPSPVLTATTTLCSGTTATFSSSLSGGFWLSTTPAVASVGSASGIVTALAPGATTISYTLPSGCAAARTLSVNLTPAAITGPPGVCIGQTITRSSTTPGGSWSSSIAAIAAIGSSGPLSCAISGVSLGTAIISYTLPGGCAATSAISVNPYPAPIGGLPEVCAGNTALLTNTTSGGLWSSAGSGIISVGSASGIITGIASGTTTISYTLPSGCAASVTGTVDLSPAPITGSSSLCLYVPASLTNSVAGGIWSSSDYTTLDIVAGSGLATGLATGAVTVTYSLPATGCFTTLPIAVNPAPAAILGVATVCVGSSSTLYNSVSGGSWSSSAPGIAAINAATGVYTGIAPGTATLSYATGPGCSVSYTVTVNALPGTISGSSSVCVGASIILTDTAAGGIWSSSSPYAAVGSSSGSVTGLSAGVALIRYTTGTGCAATAAITVNPLPPAITGSSHVCPATTTLLSCPGGGSWLSSNTAIATVGSASGSVLGIMPGSVAITYTLPSGCSAVMPLSVNMLPAPIAGSAAICIGSTATLSDPSSGGTWSKSNANVSIGSTSGSLTGIAAGTAVITYTGGTGSPYAGCIATMPVTVSPAPAAISGSSSVCPGATTPLSDATPGGTWLSSNTAIASIGSAGSLLGITAGTASITYTAPTGCYTVRAVTVSPLPTAYAITGGGSFCAGGAGLHVGLAASAAGTTYQLFTGSTPGISLSGTGAPIDFGVQTAPGSYTITATSAAGCSAPMSGAVGITVNPLPAPIGGPSAVCAGASITLTDAGGGLWSCAAPAIAVIGSTSGSLTGVAMGSAVITYTLPSSCFITTTVSVSAGPGAISGPSAVCAGATIALGNTVTGGLWSSSHPTTASIGSLSGIVAGLAPGTTTISYSLGAGCTVSTAVAVAAAPAAITGSASLCTGATTPLSDGTSGGVWSSANTAVAAISGSGTVSGITADTVTIFYTVLGCSAARLLTVHATPAPIGGSTSVCVGATASCTNTVTGGIWSTAAATLSIGSASGIITGISGGTAVITYSIGACTATRTITVSPAASISGATGLCTGTSSLLTPSIAGGTWSSGAPAIATVGLTSGSVSGSAAGTAPVTYTTPAGCSSVVTVNVSTGPTTIGGPTSVCEGASVTLTNGAPGGFWSTASPHITVGSSSGIVTGISNGTAIVTYSLGSGCQVTASVSVLSAPAAIVVPSGAAVCEGATIALSDPTPGCSWSSGSPAVASVSGSGAVTGITSGTAVISCALGACSVTTTITVQPLPAPITGIATLCAGLSATCADASAGGSWSSASSHAVIGSSSGIVTGSSAGTAVISYTLPTGCTTTATITINAAPAPISGGLSLCTGSTTTLTDATSGGSWSSAAPAVATVVAGVVTGIATGSSTISYTVGGCPALAIVTVHALPAAIAGSSSVCVAATTVLSDTTAGGTWYSSAPAVAIIGSASGSITGVAAGSATISYSLGAGCTVTMPVTVQPLPAPIAGAAIVCLGSTVTLTDAAPGGTWSSSATAVGSVSATGVVAGIAGGSATISYTLSATGCAATHAISVQAVPAIAGIHPLCAWGDTMTITDAATSGIYTSTLVTATNFGGGAARITANAPGTGSVTYILPSGCTATAAITVHPLPAIITGAAPLCIGGTLSLSDATAGGTWTATGAAITIGSLSGLVTATAPGISIVSYSIPATQCHVDTPVQVYPFPNAGSILGTDSICVGSSALLTDSAAGGTWTATGPEATIAAGILLGVSPGTDTILYTVTNTCGSAVATFPVTVNPLPAPAVISGMDSICIGYSITLAASGSGTGTWSAVNTNAAISAPGSLSAVITGLAAGYDTISYARSAAGCTTTTTFPITIIPLSGCSLAASTENIPAGQFRIWPNPASGTITATSTGSGSLSLSDITGRNIASYNINPGENNITLPLNIAPGVYILTFKNNIGTKQEAKLIIH